MKVYNAIETRDEDAAKSYPVQHLDYIEKSLKKAFKEEG